MNFMSKQYAREIEKRMDTKKNSISPPKYSLTKEDQERVLREFLAKTKTLAEIQTCTQTNCEMDQIQDVDVNMDDMNLNYVEKEK